MKEWKEYLFKVNGFEMTAVYNEDTIQKVFLPLLKQLQQLQKGKRNGSLYLWQHRLPLERQHYVSFWNIYQNKIKSLQTFKH